MQKNRFANAAAALFGLASNDEKRMRPPEDPEKTRARRVAEKAAEHEERIYHRPDRAERIATAQAKRTRKALALARNAPGQMIDERLARIMGIGRPPRGEL